MSNSIPLKTRPHPSVELCHKVEAILLDLLERNIGETRSSLIYKAKPAFDLIDKPPESIAQAATSAIDTLIADGRVVEAWEVGMDRLYPKGQEPGLRKPSMIYRSQLKVTIDQSIIDPAIAQTARKKRAKQKPESPELRPSRNERQAMKTKPIQLDPYVRPALPKECESTSFDGSPILLLPSAVRARFLQAAKAAGYPGLSSWVLDVVNMHVMKATGKVCPLASNRLRSYRVRKPSATYCLAISAACALENLGLPLDSPIEMRIGNRWIAVDARFQEPIESLDFIRVEVPK